MDAGDTFEVVPHEVAPSRDRRRLVVAGLLVGAVALVGGLFVVGGGSNEGDDERVRPPDTATPSTATDADNPETVLELMPAGPLDGKDSWRLPVLVIPQSDVADGETVTVLGRGFLPDERVGVVMCASEAATEGVGACSLGDSRSTFRYVTYADADENGDVQAPLRVRQNIDTPATGAIDCASEPERCLVAIGAVSDYDRSGGSFVNFAGAPAFAEVGILVDPVGPYAPGQVVRVGAAGLIPTRDVELVQCLDDVCLLLQRGQVSADGTFIASGAVQPVLTSPDGGPLPCGTSCVLRVQGTGLRSASSAPMPDDIPIAFVDDGRAPLPAEPPPTTSPPTAPPLTETTVTAPVESTVAPTTSVLESPPPVSTTSEVEPPVSTTTSEVPSTSTTGPPPVDSAEPEQWTSASLAAASELVVVARVSGFEVGGSRAEITVHPARVLEGAIDAPMTVEVDVSLPGIGVPEPGDELLLFLVPNGSDVSVGTHALTTAAGLLTVEQGIVVGGLEGSPVLDELVSLTVDEVAERLGG